MSRIRLISKKNNGKVFENDNGDVSLWKPISEFVISEYKKRFLSEGY